jgi:drug/metabolite transporter (DMT)-like permease
MGEGQFKFWFVQTRAPGRFSIFHFPFIIFHCRKPKSPHPAHRRQQPLTFNDRFMKKAALMLVFCCVLWGFSFPAMQLAIEALRLHSSVPDLGLRAEFLGWRFGLAALATLVLFPSVRRSFSRDDLFGGALLGALFSLGMLCQIAGLRYALPSVSSFLTSLTVIFTPLAQALLFKRPVSLRTWLGVALAAAGLAVFSIPNPQACASCTVTESPPFPWLGEILTTAGALFFTAQVLVLDRFGPRCNSARMTLAMFAAASALPLAAGVLFGGAEVYRSEALLACIRDWKFAMLLLSLTLLSSVLAIHLMNRYQRFVSPAAASVMYSTESVFATLFSLAFQTEKLTLFTVAGGVFILAAVVVVTTKQN